MILHQHQIVSSKASLPDRSHHITLGIATVLDLMGGTKYCLNGKGYDEDAVDADKQEGDSAVYCVGKISWVINSPWRKLAESGGKSAGSRSSSSSNHRREHHEAIDEELNVRTWMNVAGERQAWRGNGPPHEVSQPANHHHFGLYD